MAAEKPQHLFILGRCLHVNRTLGLFSLTNMTPLNEETPGGALKVMALAHLLGYGHLGTKWHDKGDRSMANIP